MDNWGRQKLQVNKQHPADFDQ